MRKARTIVMGMLLLGMAVTVYAAECREGGIVVSGGTCAVVNGHCACSN